MPPMPKEGSDAANVFQLERVWFHLLQRERYARQ